MAMETPSVLALDAFVPEHAYSLARQTTQFTSPKEHYNVLSKRYSDHGISDCLLLPVASFVELAVCAADDYDQNAPHAAAFHYGSVLGLAVAETIGGTDLVDSVAIVGNASEDPKDIWGEYMSTRKFVRATLEFGQQAYERVKEDYAVLDVWGDAFKLGENRQFFYQGFGWMLHLTGEAIRYLQLEEMRRQSEQPSGIDWNAVLQTILSEADIQEQPE